MKHAALLLAFVQALVLSALVSPFAAAQNVEDFVAGINYPAGPPVGPSNTGYWFGGISPVEVHIGDFNGDGKPDVVVAASCSLFSGNGSSGISNCPANGSAVVVYLGNGDGTFGAPIVSGANLPPGIRSLVVGDFNGDGKLDVAAAADCLSGQDCSAGTVSILLGNGDGTFTQSSQYPLNGVVGQAGTLGVGDFNGDGRLDLVVGIECYNIPTNGCAVGSVSIYLGNGDGTLASPTSYSTVGNTALLPVVGDFNGDGKLDVIAGSAFASGGNTSNSSLTVLLGNGDGTFIQPVNDQVTLPFSSLDAITMGDLNSDGKLDLVLTSYYGSVDVALGNGDGSFQTPSAISTALSYLLDSQVIDLNHDGHPDIVVSAQGATGSLQNGVQVLLNDGTGNFVPASVYGLGGTGGQALLATSDFNDDGNADLILASVSSGGGDGSLSILLGNGNGTMQAATILNQILGTVYATITADVNGDGIPDLVESVYVPSNGNQGGILVFLGTGNGQYAAPTLYTAGVTTASGLVAGDFNKDGKIDIAAVNDCLDDSCAQGGVTILVGNGDGTFQSPVSYGTGGQYSLALVTGDFNGDGQLDVAALSQSSGVSILLGNGDGTLQPAVVTTAGSLNLSLAAADFNNDGKSDIALYYYDSGANSGFVQVFLSGANGALSAIGSPYSSGGEGPLYQVNVRGGGLAIADVNRDGNLDIVVANQCQSSDTGCAFGSLAVLDGNGDGTFRSGPIQNALQGDGNYYSLFLTDVNGDGILDAIASDSSGVEVLFGKTDGSFLPPTAYAGAANLGQTTTLALADLNIIQPGAGTSSTAIFVNRAGTYLVTKSSANPSDGAPSITLTTNASASYLQGLTPTGSITYFEGTINLGSVPLVAGTASLTITGVSQGVYTILPYYSGDSNFFSHFGTPILQVVSSAMASQTITFTTPAPATAKSGDKFTVAATGGGSGNPVIFTVGVGSVCTLSGAATYTMTSDSGYCYVIANQAAGGNYTAAPQIAEIVNAVRTVVKIAPTVTFTGAPTDSPYLSAFTVATTQNSGITPTITAAPSATCSISGTTVTMNSGTGTCTLTAKWTTDDYYLAATITQKTSAQKLMPTVAFTGAPTDAPYLSTFTVATTQNSGITPTITSTTGSVCSISSGIVTMKMGTGTCTVKASWATNKFYLTASLEQNTTGTQIGTTTTITSTVPQTNPLKVEVHFTVSNGTSTVVTGSVTVTAAPGGETCTGTVTSGKCLLTFTAAGSEALTAVYAGNNDDSTSTSVAYPMTVN
jgi:FG-GAP-like repeat